MRTSLSFARLHDQKGQSVLVVALFLSVFVASTIGVLALHSHAVGRAHVRARDALIVIGVVDKLGVQIRRYYDLAKTSPTCVGPGGTVLGTETTVGSTKLCIPATMTEICVEDPSSANRRFCVPVGSIFAQNTDGPAPDHEAVLVAGLRRPEDSVFRETAIGAAQLSSRYARTFANMFALVPESRAQRSDSYRPPPPPPGSVNNSLGGPTATPITCGTGSTCVTVRICDVTGHNLLRVNCSEDSQVTYQRFAFLD